MLIPRAELTSQEPSKSPAAYRRAAMTLSSSSVKAKMKRCRRGASVRPAGWSMSADATTRSPSVERASKKMPRRAEGRLRRACGQDRGRPDRVRPIDSKGIYRSISFLIYIAAKLISWLRCPSPPPKAVALNSNGNTSNLMPLVATIPNPI